MFNVRYDTPSSFRLYLNEPTDIITAWSQCHKFHEKYVGKPYPNGKGYYPFTNPRVVAVCRTSTSPTPARSTWSSPSPHTPSHSAPATTPQTPPRCALLEQRSYGYDVGSKGRRAGGRSH